MVQIRVMERLILTFKMGAERSMEAVSKSFAEFFNKVMETKKSRRIGSHNALPDPTSPPPPNRGSITGPRSSQRARLVENAPLEIVEISAAHVEVHLLSGDMIMEIQLQHIGVQLEEEREEVKAFDDMRITKKSRLNKTFILWVGPRTDLISCKPQIGPTHELVKTHFLIARRLYINKGTTPEFRRCITVGGFYIKLKADEDLPSPLTDQIAVDVKKCDVIFDSAIKVSHLNDIRYLVAEFGKTTPSTHPNRPKPPDRYQIMCHKEHFEFSPQFEGVGGIIEVDLLNVLRRISVFTGMNFMSIDYKELIVPLVYNNGVLGLGEGVRVGRNLLESLEQNLR
ncbi:hypothetical protein AAMO2058_001100200 [Amorphochlora amoebiformis]